jgi:amidase
MDALHYATATALTAAYAAGEVSPLEAMEACIARIDAVDPVVNAYVTVDREGALAAAGQATAALGTPAAERPLHGIPVGIKDLTETAGMRTTFGSTIYADHVPTADDLIVQRLRAAGAIIVGKTNTPEFGAGGNTFNDVFGATRNPYDPALTCGGSSGGSAVALATGMSPLCEGSDLGGSLRTPASFCNVVGFRTTPGLVPVWPDSLPWEGLAVTGPMARTVTDCALMLAVVAGPDDRVPLSYDVDARSFLAAVREPSISGARVAFTPDLGGLLPVDPEVAAICEEAARVLDGLGARVEDASPDMRDVRDIVLATRGVAMVVYHAEHLREHREAMQPGLVWNIDQGLSLTPEGIADGLRKRAALWERVAAFMADRDFLVLPTVAVQPFPVEQPYPVEVAGVPLADYTQWFHLTYAITLTGLPVISVPCGFTAAGLPVGLQIVGRRRREAEVLRAAAAYEAATGWHERHPSL